MDQKLAVLFMPDDMTLTKEQTPLMLRPILFCPILTWMVEELMGRGIERFFIVSDKRAHDMMCPYVPEHADVVYVDGARHGEELLTLLKDEKGSVLIVNGAVLPVGVFSGGAVYSADAKECCKVLKEIMEEFANFKKSKTLHGLIIEINALEEEGDRLFIDSMRRLHTEVTDPLEIIAWREIYNFLEKCCDACEHVADAVESVIMKNT